MWLIWSIEHNAWWKPNELGYTIHRDEAGRYPFETAKRIVAAANVGLVDKPNEAMLEDVKIF